MSFNPNDWSNKIKLTIDSSKIDEDLVDFPVLITLSSGSGISVADTRDIFNELSYDDRKKIVITVVSGTSENCCYTEIEKWDHANQQAWLWTKVPTITSGTDTTLYLYYDKTQPDNNDYVGDTGDSAAKSVWESNFVGVWHMAQDPSGDAVDAILDSTTNANHGTPEGSMTSANLVDGQVNGAIEFDGINDGINVGDSADYTFAGDFTIEALTSTSKASGIELLIGTGNANNSGEWELEVNRTAGKLTFYEGGSSRLTSVASVNDGDFKHLFLVRESNTLTLYINGSFDEDASYSTTLNGSELFFGITYAGTIPYLGVIDIVRMSNAARSVAWVKADYYSCFDDLITFGSEEETTFYFSNHSPPHLSTVYGLSQLLELTVTVSGLSESYEYDAKFYNADSGDQIGTTTSGVNSSISVSTTLTTYSGSDYNWYVWATSSGVASTSDTYTFTNKFLCQGTTTVNGTATSGIPVRLYKRDDGSLVGSTISAGVSGTFSIESDYNEYHYAVALSLSSGTNALIYDYLKPGE